MKCRMMTNLLSPSECGMRKHHLSLTAHGFTSVHDYVVHVDLISGSPCVTLCYGGSQADHLIKKSSAPL